MSLLRTLASLKLTVALFVLGMIVVVWGTLAQIGEGVWYVQKTYFYSYFFWAHLGILASGTPESVEGLKRIGTYFPGGFTIGWLMLINLLAAHFIRFRFTVKRLGVYILHSGLILLLVGEFLTANFSVHTSMTISEGGSNNYTLDTNELELLLHEKISSTEVKTTRLPLDQLQKNSVIRPDDVPFSIKLDRWIENLANVSGQLQEVPKAKENNAPAVVLSIVGDDDKATSQPIQASLAAGFDAFNSKKFKLTEDSAEYALSFRFRRYYKDYTITLKDFKTGEYTGTNIPSHYQSDIHFQSHSSDVEFDRLIKMNNPLRHGGETFYQAGFTKDADGRDATILQVVRNPGWQIPYIACLVISFGLLWHFCILLYQFIKRAKVPSFELVTLKRSHHLFVWGVVLLAVILAISPWVRAGKSNPEHLNQLAALPVSLDGRVKPLDSAARSFLIRLSGRDKLKVRDDGDRLKIKKIPAIEWYFNSIVSPEKAENYSVFRIEHDGVLALLDLKIEDGIDKFFYSYSQIEPKLANLQQELTSRPDKRDPSYERYKKAIEILLQRVTLFQQIQNLIVPYHLPPSIVHDPSVSEVPPPLSQWHPMTLELNAPTENYKSWKKLLQTYKKFQDAPEKEELAKTLAAEAEKYRNNIESTDYTASEESKVAYELLYNQAAPFLVTLIMYLLAFVMGLVLIAFQILKIKDWQIALLRATFGFISVAFLLHTFGLCMRMYIQGRPPVTTLYSVSIFVGWGVVLMGLIFEYFYRRGTGVLVASTVGWLTLIMAYNQVDGSDHMGVMLAVLNSNFWLATHVIMITFGYSVSFLAGFIGIVYILRRFFGTAVTKEENKTYGKMIYGAVCFALLFSFIGTVLGGIWGDQSWGRFWGWDPKENGALLIVLMHSLILHARWGGMVRERGMMILAVFGNIITSISWFGVNMLGVGLHSYGFMASALFWLLLFWGSQLMIMALGAIPENVLNPHLAADGASGTPRGNTKKNK